MAACSQSASTPNVAAAASLVADSKQDIADPAQDLGDQINAQEGKQDSLSDQINAQEGIQDSLSDQINAQEGNQDSPSDPLDGQEGNQDAPFDPINDLKDENEEMPDPIDAAPIDTAPIDTAPTVAGSLNPPTCLADDAAWLSQTMPLILGRRPLGIREQNALVWHIKAAGRAAVVQAMAQHNGYLRLWSDRLFDLLSVPVLTMPDARYCASVRTQPTDSGQIAAAMTTAKATALVLNQPATLRDVAWSSLQLNDIRAFIRAAVFLSQLEPPAYCANVSLEQTWKARNLMFGRRFMAGTVGRQLDCLGCHNSDFGVSDALDPKKDLHWPVAGSFEKAIFGAATGKPELEVYAFFRYHGFVSKASLVSLVEGDTYPADPVPAVTPWGMHPKCGLFLPEAALGADALPYKAYLAGPGPAKASLWALDALLLESMQAVTAYPDWPDTQKLALDGKRALGWLIAANVVNRTWEIALGRPLTLSHGFARNSHQRDKLAQLTQLFIQSGWSLRALLAAIATDPWFALLQPAAGCGGIPYAAAPLLEPFAIHDKDPIKVGNSVGDAVRALRFDQLFEAARSALALPPVDTTAYGNSGEAMLSLFITEWANSDFPPRPLVSRPTTMSLGMWRMAVGDGTLPLEQMGGGVVFESKPTGDILDALPMVVAANPTATVRALIETLRDRVWLAPAIPPAEVPLLAELFGVASLDEPVAKVGLQVITPTLRAYIGLLLSDMRFTHTGLTWPAAMAPAQLVLDGKSTHDHCTFWLPLVWPVGKYPPSQYTISCGANGVTVLVLP